MKYKIDITQILECFCVYQFLNLKGGKKDEKNSLLSEWSKVLNPKVWLLKANYWFVSLTMHI